MWKAFDKEVAIKTANIVFLVDVKYGQIVTAIISKRSTKHTIFFTNSIKNAKYIIEEN